MKRTLIRCGWIVSVDETIGDLTDAEILVTGEKITAIGKSLGAEADEIIDAPDMIAMPGLINAHMHTWQTGFRNIGGDWMSADYFRNVHGVMGSLCESEDNFLATLVGALDQINSGVTTLGDWCHNLRNLEMAERAIDGLEESGIRAVFFHGTAKPEALGSNESSATAYTNIPHPRERIAALRRDRLASDDRLITLALGILGPDLSFAKVALHDFRLAREFGLISGSHIYRPPEQRIEQGVLALLAKEGLLGPDHNVAHGNFMSDDELDLAVDNGITFTATCLAELRGASPEPLMRRLKQRGAYPSLGIDTPPTAASDLFAEMRMARYCARREESLDYKRAGKGLFTSPPVKPLECLQWATINGARALRLDHVTGSLTPGKKADIVLINGSDLSIAPVHHALNTVVDFATGANVDTVLIDGEIRKRNGALVYPKETLNKRMRELHAASARIIAASKIDIPGIALRVDA